MKKLIKKWLGITSIEKRQNFQEERLQDEWDSLIARQWEMCEQMDKCIDLNQRTHNTILSVKHNQK